MPRHKSLQPNPARPAAGSATTASAATSRRKFLKTSSFLGGSFLITGTKASGQIDGASDRVRIAVCGLNGRGQSHIEGWLGQENVEIVYVVDPDEKVQTKGLKGIERRLKDEKNKTNVNTNVNTKAIRDVREALEDKSLDAISIATPNHWHSLMTIWAAQHGKHVYVEKPMSHDVAEGRVAVAAQQKYGIVIQHGTQRRSDPGIAGLHEALHNGDLPRLKIAYGYCCKPRAGIGTKPVGEPPANLDWELWKGPAVIEEFHGNFHPYNWHWFWKTGNGDLNNQGTHQLDVARWAIDPDQTHPVRTMALGGRFKWDDQGETPNTMFGMAEYPNGQTVMFNVRNVHYKDYNHQVYNEYYLEDGSVITGESKYMILRPGKPEPEPLELPPGNVTPGGNWRSFITAVRANDPNMANGNALDAHYGCVMGHLMNNSYRLGEPKPFNEQAVDFGDNAAAREHFGKLHAIMRDGVGISESDAQYTVGPWLTFDPETERHVGEHAEAANRLLKDPNNPGFQIPTVDEV